MKEPMTEDQRARLKKLACDAVDAVCSDGAIDQKGTDRILAKGDELTENVVALMLKMSVPEVTVGNFGSAEDYIIQMLVDLKLVSEEQIANAKEAVEALQYSNAIEAMVASGLISKENIYKALAGHFGMDFVDLCRIEIAENVIKVVPRHVARRYMIVPIKKEGNTITIALSNPMDVDTLDSLRYVLKMDVEGVVATPDEIEDALKKYYPGENPEVIIPALDLQVAAHEELPACPKCGHTCISSGDTYFSCPNCNELVGSP